MATVVQWLVAVHEKGLGDMVGAAMVFLSSHALQFRVMQST